MLDAGSHPARGAWIETHPDLPHNPFYSSHPARGAWIETEKNVRKLSRSCRTPLGVRGLKQWLGSCNRSYFGRTPLGVRGLKHCQ